MSNPLKEIYDGFGPEPGMSFVEFRKQVRELSDPALMRKDLDRILAQRKAGRQRAAQIDAAIRRN